jgi:5-methylcytosine-specific restriction endonuclease McrA
MSHALVLNKNWVAISVTSSFGALISMCRERASAMCPETYKIYDIEAWIDRSIKNAGGYSEDNVVRTVNFEIEKPEIVIVKDYGGIPFKQVNLTRRNLYKRDQYTCQYCTRGFTPKDLTIDHIIPTSRGGAHSWENCITSCERCNASKANRTPQECGMVLNTKPRMPKWTPIAGILPSIKPESWSKFLKI